MLILLTHRYGHVICFVLLEGIVSGLDPVVVVVVVVVVVGVVVVVVVVVAHLIQDLSLE